MTGHVGSLGTNGLPVTPLSDRTNDQQVWLESWNNMIANPFSSTFTAIDNSGDFLWVDTVIDSGLNVFINTFPLFVLSTVNVILIKDLVNINITSF